MKWLLVFLLPIITACAPSAQAIQTSIAQTQAAYTPTVAPTPTPDLVKEYIDQLLPKMDVWHTAFEEIGVLHKQYSEDQSISQTDPFIQELTLTSAHLLIAADSFEQLPPAPPQLEKLDQAVDKLAESTKSFEQTYILAITLNDATMMQISLTPLQEMTASAEIINQELAKNK